MCARAVSAKWQIDREEWASAQDRVALLISPLTHVFIDAARTQEKQKRKKKLNLRESSLGGSLSDVSLSQELVTESV